MFVRCKKRFKDGKEHRYWSVVENVRVSGGRVVQRQVLYLGEINDSQRAAWCRSIEVVEGASRSKQVALFPEDREAPELECEVVQVRLAELTLHAPRQWGACWLALTLWERLELDRFWGLRLRERHEIAIALPQKRRSTAVRRRRQVAREEMLSLMHEGVNTDDVAHRWRAAALVYFHDLTLKAARNVRESDVETNREGLSITTKGKKYWIPRPPSEFV